jgi:hypothetical protein
MHETWRGHVQRQFVVSGRPGINSAWRRSPARRIGIAQKANKNRRNHTSNSRTLRSGVRAGGPQPADGLGRCC